MEAQSSSWALRLLRLPLMHTDVICCSGPGTRRGTNNTAPNRYCNYTCWHNTVRQRVSAVHISTLFAQFPATLGNFTDFFHQDVKLMNQKEVSFNFISLLLPLNTSFRMEQFMITWLTLTLHPSRIHNINSHNKAYFKYFFNPLRKPISSLNVPLIYSK